MHEESRYTCTGNLEKTDYGIDIYIAVFKKVDVSAHSAERILMLIKSVKKPKP